MRSQEGDLAGAKVHDVSLSGALLETPCRAALMSQVDIRPAIPTAHWRRAFVIRRTENGVAVEWFEPCMRWSATYPLGQDCPGKLPTKGRILATISKSAAR